MSSVARENMASALLALMKEKPYADISVSELADRAGYDRKTYYRHFHSMEEVLTTAIAGLLREMANLMQDAGPLTVRSGFTAFFTFFSRHMETLQLLEQNDLLHFLEREGDAFLYEYVGRTVQPDIPETLQDTSDLSRYSYYFTAGGLWHVLARWVREPEEERRTPEEVAAHLVDCIAGLSWYLESE